MLPGWPVESFLKPESRLGSRQDSDPAAPSPIRERVSAVLPLRIGRERNSPELARASILFDSLRRHAEPGFVQDLLVVVPESDVRRAHPLINAYPDIGLRLVPETELVPGLRNFRRVHGWWKQQIIKLAACRLFHTRFYITLDADVVCVGRLNADRLLPGGRALLHPLPRSRFPHWWSASARLLKVPPRLDCDGMAATPAVLATECCSDLIAELGMTRDRLSWVERLLRPHRLLAPQRLVPGFRFRHRWTEYSLYYLFSEKRGVLDLYHVSDIGPEAPNSLCATESIWRRKDFETWDPKTVRGDPRRPIFCVIQSSARVDPLIVRERIRPLLE